MRPRWCVLLIAGLAAGGEEVIKTKVALPVAPKAGKPASVPRHMPLVVTLTKQGRIVVGGANFFFGDPVALEIFKVEPGLAHVNLDQLSRMFGLAVSWYEIKAKAARTKAFEERAGLDRVFLRKLRIRADRDAPWAFIQWTAMVAAEQKVTDLQLELEGRRTLDLRLPPFKGAWGEIVMHLEGYLEDVKPEPHVVVDVCRGKRTHYVVGKEETTKPDRLEAMLRKRLATKPVPKVVVRADLSVPFQDVVTAFDRIYAAGAKQMWWLGEHIPQPELRQLERLPPPPR